MAKKRKQRSSSSSSGGGSAPSSTDLLQQQMSANQNMFQLDLDEKKRAADMQNAQFIAEQMRLRMESEIRSRGYLVQPVRDSSGNWTGEFQAMLDGAGKPIPSMDAAKQARELALQEGEFELTKLKAEREYGLTYQDQQFRQAMDSRRQRWTETYQQAQTALAEGDLTGYYNGMETLDRQKWQADASGYMPNGQSTLARQKAEWDTVLNAPRGPADWTAYMNRMRGIAGSGNAPGVLQQFIGGGRVANASGDPNSQPMPASNTDLAMSLVYGGQQRGYPGGPVPQGPTPAQQMQGGWDGGQPPPALPGGGYIAPPGWTPPGGAQPGTPGSNLPGFPWQAPPPGGSWTPPPSAPGAPSVPAGPPNQGALAQAIYGQGLQGVGHFDVDHMSQQDFDEWLRLLHSGGSGFDDPRIAAIANAARSSGYNMGAYDNWAQNGNGKPWLNPVAPPPPAPGQPAPSAPGEDPGTSYPPDPRLPPEPRTPIPGQSWDSRQLSPQQMALMKSTPVGFGADTSKQYSYGGPIEGRGPGAMSPFDQWRLGQRKGEDTGSSPDAGAIWGNASGAPSGGYRNNGGFVPRDQGGSPMPWERPAAPSKGGYSSGGVDPGAYGRTSRMMSNIFGGSQPNSSFGTGSSAYGGSQSTPVYSGARGWSAQQFRKLSPTEQQFTLGWNQETNSETPEDAQWLMQQGAPKFRKARQAQYSGIG